MWLARLGKDLTRYFHVGASYDHLSRQLVTKRQTSDEAAGSSRAPDRARASGPAAGFKSSARHKHVITAPPRSGSAISDWTSIANVRTDSRIET